MAFGRRGMARRRMKMRRGGGRGTAGQAQTGGNMAPTANAQGKALGGGMGGGRTAGPARRGGPNMGGRRRRFRRGRGGTANERGGGRY